MTLRASVPLIASVGNLSDIKVFVHDQLPYANNRRERNLRF